MPYFPSMFTPLIDKRPSYLENMILCYSSLRTFGAASCYQDALNLGWSPTPTFQIIRLSQKCKQTLHTNSKSQTYIENTGFVCGPDKGHGLA